MIGFPGSGKSTMLAAARRAWGTTVVAASHGAALAAGSDGLTSVLGIASRTLASWSFGLGRTEHPLGHRDVLVIDEAGMIGSRQLCRFVREVEARGAELVLVGDHEQLQAIGAGWPFRAIRTDRRHRTDRHGPPGPRRGQRLGLDLRHPAARPMLWSSMPDTMPSGLPIIARRHGHLAA
ncbi:AAA family ATPase [Rhizobium nepotum]|uniref:AAA family ATPase n=1 Tax=Rhizobium nepotum TaxID=1035271 RepID=UPI003CF2D4C5